MKKLLFYTWISISFFVRLFYSFKLRKKKKECKQMIEDHVDYLNRAGFAKENVKEVIDRSSVQWESDLFNGKLDNIAKPWHVLAKGGDDCDSLALLWCHILSQVEWVEKARCLAVISGLKGGHVFCMFKPKGEERWCAISNTRVYKNNYKYPQSLAFFYDREYKFAFFYDDNLKLHEVIPYEI